MLAVGAAVSGVALALCVSPVDQRPYFDQNYYRETSARWEALAKKTNAVVGGVWAGFGRARLTPTLNALQDSPAKGEFRSLPLAGYGDRHGKPAHGANGDLYIKAVALKVGGRLGVMVGADALIIPPEVTTIVMSNLQAQAGLERERVYLSATHTHCSFGGWGEGFVAEQFAGPFQPGLRVWFADRIVTAIHEAMKDLKPASIGAGQFSAPEFVRNRLVGELGRVDPAFSYVLLRQEGGRNAVLGSYSAHATVLSGDMMDFSADYPGFWQRTVEESGVDLAVFLAGGVGSHGPRPPMRGIEGAEQMGKALSELLVARLPQTRMTNSMAFDMIGLEVSLPPLNARLTDGIRLRPWVAKKLLRVAGPTYLQAFRIGDAIWVSTPCDFSGEMALDIKDFARGKGANAVVTSFNGDYIGYVIPCKYYHRDGYEPRVMSFFGPNVPSYLDELIRKMISHLAEE